MGGLATPDPLNAAPPSPRVFSSLAMTPFLCLSTLPFSKIKHPGETKAIGGQEQGWGGVEAMGRLAEAEPAPSSRENAAHENKEKAQL